MSDSCINLRLQGGVDKMWGTATFSGSWSSAVEGTHTLTIADETGTVLKQVSAELRRADPTPTNIFKGLAVQLPPGRHTITGTFSGPCGSTTSTTTLTVPQVYSANYLAGLSFKMTFTGKPRKAPYAGCWANTAIGLLGNSSATSTRRSTSGWDVVSSPSPYFSTEMAANTPYVMGGHITVRSSSDPAVTRRVSFNAFAADESCHAQLVPAVPRPVKAFVLDAGTAVLCGSLSYARPSQNTFNVSVVFQSCGGSYAVAPDPSVGQAHLAVAKWALDRVGRIAATANERKVLANYGIDWKPEGDGPLGEWSGDCWRFASLAWMAQRVPTKTGVTAFQAMNYYAGKGKLTTKGVPPAGAIIFYSGVIVAGVDLGHAAISIGKGQAISTSGLDGDQKPIRQHDYKLGGGLTYRGYVTDPKP